MTRPSSARKLLLPLVPAYRLALWLRELRRGTELEPVRRLRFPVVSIGNLSTGGAGKTPLTIALAKALTQRSFQVDVLSRGYGRRSELPACVNPRGDADEFGDEPLLIARETGLPVYVARQRYEAGLLAEADLETDGGENHWPIVHLLDDGFQHRQLTRDVDILLLNRDDLPDSLLPAGNLREPLLALQRATVLAIPADEPEVEQYLGEVVLIDRNSETSRWIGPVWRLHRKMEVPAVDGPVVAFCGIARPEQFFAGLESAGMHLAARMAFPDHHRFTVQDVESLLANARDVGAAALLTTEKDLVRLGKLASNFSEALPVKAVGLRIEIEDENQAIEWLGARIDDRLKLAPAHKPL